MPAASCRSTGVRSPPGTPAGRASHRTPGGTSWSPSAGRTDEARAVQFAVPYMFLAHVRGVSVHDCQRHSAGVFTDPDRYLVAFGAFLDGLPPVSRRRLEEVGLFHDGRLIEADAATGDVDAMTAAGFQRWLRASLAKFIFKSRRLGRAGRIPASRGRAGARPLAPIKRKTVRCGTGPRTRGFGVRFDRQAVAPTCLRCRRGCRFRIDLEVLTE